MKEKVILVSFLFMVMCMFMIFPVKGIEVSDKQLEEYRKSKDTVAFYDEIYSKVVKKNNLKEDKIDKEALKGLDDVDLARILRFNVDKDKNGDTEKDIYSAKADKKSASMLSGYNTIREAVEEMVYGPKKNYKLPSISDNNRGNGSLDEIIDDADNFVNKQGNNDPINIGDIQDMSKKIYGILLEIAVGIAVLIGLILGIKLMIAGVDEKADAKKMMWVYLVGCIVSFGSFGIWKIVIEILEKI